MKMTVFISMVLALMAASLSSVRAQTQSVTLEFQIHVTGVSCPNATYWVLIGSRDEQFYQQLTDSDGDNVYTLRLTEGVGAERAIRLVQGVGTQQLAFGPEPNPPILLIQNFGVVTITGDMVFEGRVAGCPSTLPDTGRSSKSLTALFVGSLLLLASGMCLRQYKLLCAS
jgi:LPXTG-motif cell wall-anchored protein